MLQHTQLVDERRRRSAGGTKSSFNLMAQPSPGGKRIRYFFILMPHQAGVAIACSVGG